MKALNNLILSDMVIEGKSSLLESLGALPNLKTLDLSGSELRGTVIGKGALPNLKTLYLLSSKLRGRVIGEGNSLVF